MSDLTPLTPADERLYRDGLRDAPSVAGLDPMRTTLADITVAEWADRCRRLLATLDAARRDLDYANDRCGAPEAEAER